MGLWESVVDSVGVEALVGDSVIMDVFSVVEIRESVVVTVGGDGVFGDSEGTGTVELLVECIDDGVGDGGILNELLVENAVESNGGLVAVVLDVRVIWCLIDSIVLVAMVVGITRVTGIGSVLEKYTMVNE